MVSERQVQSKQLSELNLTQDDGSCYFEYDVVEPGQFDYISLDSLLTMARAVLTDCVGIQNRGGVANGLGALDFGLLRSHGSR